MIAKNALLTCFLVYCSIATAWAQEPDWSLYDHLLKQSVSQKTVDGLSLAWVDYSALVDSKEFDLLVEQLERFDPERLEGDSQRLAFYINAYNILAIDMVRRHWPVASIKEAGAWYRPVWEVDAGKIGGKSVTLDQIEHRILRKLDEPRVHFAIVCASRSCPDLSTEAYRSKTLDQQLDLQVKSFLGNSGKGLLQQGDKVAVSRIFDWFEDDFEPQGGVEKFIESFGPQALSINDYLPYDWSLNGS